MTQVRERILPAADAGSGTVRKWWGELSNVTRVLVLASGALAAGMGSLAAVLRSVP